MRGGGGEENRTEEPQSNKYRVHTEWQPPLFGVHSIMMEKLAQAGDGGGVRPPPFIIAVE